MALALESERPVAGFLERSPQPYELLPLAVVRDAARRHALLRQHAHEIAPRLLSSPEFVIQMPDGADSGSFCP